VVEVPVPGAHPAQLALAAARFRPHSVRPWRNQVDVQLVGVLGRTTASISSWAPLQRGLRREEPESAADRWMWTSTGISGSPQLKNQHAGGGFAAHAGQAEEVLARLLDRRVLVQSRLGSGPSSRRIAWIRGAFCCARPPGRIASSTSATGASRTSSQVGKRSRSNLKARPLCAIVGVLGEDRQHQLVDRPPGSARSPAPRTSPAAVREGPAPRRRSGRRQDSFSRFLGEVVVIVLQDISKRRITIEVHGRVLLVPLPPQPPGCPRDGADAGRQLAILVGVDLNLRPRPAAWTTRVVCLRDPPRLPGHRLRAFDSHAVRAGPAEVLPAGTTGTIDLANFLYLNPSSRSRSASSSGSTSSATSPITSSATCSWCRCAWR